MTVVNPKSISGINSITTGSGSDNLLTIHTSDASSTERVRINSSGDVIVGSGITVSPDGDIFTTGVTTATTFVGALTGNVTGNVSGSSGSATGNAGGLTGTPNISVGTIAGSTGTFTGDVDIADKIVHTGDTNTAIRFPAADTITLETAGSERLRIDSSGNLEVPAGAFDLRVGDDTDSNAGTQTISVGSVSSGSGGIGIFANPTNGNSFVQFGDGTSSADQYRGYMNYQHASDSLIFGTAGSEKVRITSAGNFGLATNSPVAQTLAGGTAITPVFDLKGVTQNNTSGILQFTRKDNATQGSCIYSSGDDAGLTFRNTDGNGFGFYNGTTNALRIKPDGKIGINCVPDYLFNVVSSTVDTCRFQQTTNNDATSYSLIFMKHAAATSGSNGVDITFQNSSGTTVGMIDHGQSTTQYRTSSDYRLKENAEAISDGITRLKTLKPYRFNWISEPGQPKVDGFFAHEVTTVPEAIKGTKDEVDSDNKPLYQSIDHSKLVPLLTAALQEAVAKIETLETKVAALEGS